MSPTDDAFYVTTPIFYPNDVPHIGHAYTAVTTDYLARWHRLRGDRTFHLTGTDEHGLKIQRAAEADGKAPQVFVDEMEPRWREVWERLDVAYDDYIRTTEPRHERAVAELLQAVRDNGRDDIYLAKYEGLYCVSCEFYYSEEEIAEAGGNCPIHGRPVERLTEENYFFRLSAYQDRLLEHYEANPSAVEPEVRRNEVLSVIRAGLKDFSISRTSFDWGVPLPWDPKHVCYVWFDALTNYITAAGYGEDPERFASWWPGTHMIGKDILRQHAIYWPAMLMAAGIDPPRQVWAHGYLLVGGEKMSKTKLTGIHPFELIDHFGVDAYRYYFLREIQFGGDGSFTWESMLERYNADLANGLGNLASRVLAMTDSYFEGKVPPRPDGPGPDQVLADGARRTAENMDGEMAVMALTHSLATAWELIGAVNKWLVEEAPWKTAKDPARRKDLERQIYASLEVLRVIALLTFPVMPSAARKLWASLGMPGPIEDQRLSDARRWGVIEPGQAIARGESLFPRLEG